MCLMSNAASDNCSSRGQNFYQFVIVSPVCYLEPEPFLGEMRAFTLGIYTPGEIVASTKQKPRSKPTKPLDECPIGRL